MSTVAIVQARMSSSRFPGKMLAPLAGTTLLGRVVDRVRQAERVDRVVVATSVDPSDDPLVREVKATGVEVVRGSLDDVLGRFLLALKDESTVVRVTGDCPLIDPDLLDAMLEVFERGEFDYLSNVSPPSWPEGLDLEIFSADALRTAADEAERLHDREHVTPFIRQHPERFRLGNHPNPAAGDHSDLHWSVDRPEDLDVVAELIERAGRDARLPRLMAVLEADPDLAQRSRRALANEGAIATFRADNRAAAPRLVTPEGDAMWQRAERVIPAGTQTLSKGPSQFCLGVGPKYLVRGEGCRVWDADGNVFIDYPMALGPVTLGHGHPAVAEAVARHLAEGTTFSLMHPLEVELAERLVEIIPCAEQIRFGKNGSDATSACIRAARALTGRDRILRCGYHGWQDWSIDEGYGIRARGVPSAVMNLTRPFPYNDLDAVEALVAEEAPAALILEPVSVEEPAPGYLEGLRELATRCGAVLIFDEVITGFRWARGGAQEYFGVTPDLCAMGKGVANGFPLSVVAGRREFMKAFDEVFFSFTFGGETLGLAAAMATLDVMEEADYWAHCWRQGSKLAQGFDDAAKRHGCDKFARCAGMAPWTICIFQDTERWSGLQLKTLFQQEMLLRGILFSGSQFLSLAHDDAVLEETVAAYDEAFRVLRFALDTHAVEALLEGSINELVFRRS